MARKLEDRLEDVFDDLERNARMNLNLLDGRGIETQVNRAIADGIAMLREFRRNHAPNASLWDVFQSVFVGHNDNERDCGDGEIPF